VRLEFTILWFENQLRDLANQIGELEVHIRKAGFIPNIKIERDASRLEEFSRRQEHFHEFDLVVVDWDLDGKEKGDEVARRVRRHFGFTDILFYSGKKPDELRVMVMKKAIDGVYCVHRRNLIDRLTELVDDIVVGLSRLEAMRGLAMSVVGQCDEELKFLIGAISSSKDPEVQEAVTKLLDELVQDSYKRGTDGYANCKTLDERLTSFSVTSFHLWKLALQLTRGNGFVKAQREKLKKYDTEVIKQRNALGHAIEKETENGWEVEGTLGDPITRDDFPRLREHFASHLENIRAIRVALTVDRVGEAE
jgi:hypothetical protein